MAANNKYLVQLGLILANAASAPSTTRDGPTGLEDGIVDLHSKTKLLSASIAAFPTSGGTVPQGLELHQAAVNLVNSIKNASNDATAVPSITEARATTIVGLVEAARPDIQQTLDNFVAKKAPLEGLPLPGVRDIVLEDLASVKQDFNVFSTILLSKTPAALLSTAQAHATFIANAINQAVTVYSS